MNVEKYYITLTLTVSSLGQRLQMWKSRDLALVVLIAVANFVYTA